MAIAGGARARWRDRVAMLCAMSRPLWHVCVGCVVLGVCTCGCAGEARPGAGGVRNGGGDPTEEGAIQPLHAHRSDGNRVRREMGPILTKVVLARNTDDRRRMCALLELRELGQHGALGPEELGRLAHYALQQGLPLDPFVGCRMAQVLACGDADVQALLLDYMQTDATRSPESSRLFALALALASNADPTVTDGLREFARRPDVRTHLADFVSLAVVARGRRERSSIERAVATVRETFATRPEQVADSSSVAGPNTNEEYELALLLCYAAPGLRGLPAMESALWEALEGGPGYWVCMLGPAWAQLLDGQPSRRQVKLLKQLVEEVGEDGRELCGLSVQMMLASLDVNPSAEVRAALHLVGTRYDEGMAFVLPLLLGSALSSDSPGVLLGAVRLCGYLGPRAASLTPLVRRLASEENGPVGAEARLAWEQLAGLDEQGQFRALLVEQPTAEGWTAAHAAAQSGDLTALKALMARGADLNAQTSYGETPMGIATAARQWDAVGLLLEHGGRWSALEFSDQCVALVCAAQRGDVDGVSMLTKSDDLVRIDARIGWPTLFAAATGGGAAVTKVLIEAGADVNVTNDTGRTPLHYAAERGDVDTVAVLLAGGAQADVRDQGGQTPLDLATTMQHAQVAEYLQQHGAVE